MWRRLIDLRWIFLLAMAIALLPAPIVVATEIEGVQPASLDQPRVNVVVRRTPRAKPLAASDGVEQSANIQAFLDTGASGVLLSRKTAQALGIERAMAGKEPIVFHDVGVGGSEEFGVSDPLYISIGTFSGIADGGGAGDYPISFGPIRAQINTSGGLMEMLTGGLDVVGMPAMKGRVVVIDPKPVDTFGDTMRAHLLDAKKDRKSIPRTDRTVRLSYASFARFTRTEPAGAKGPDLADNPFIGPSPVAVGTAKGNVPPIVVTLNGKESAGSWLLDTGAAASMISSEQARKLGVTYAEGTEGTDSPKLDGAPADQQFTFTIGGIGGQKKAVGFYLDTLTLPTREPDAIVYKKAPVIVADITVIDAKTGEKITLDGVLGMNYFVASANVQQAGLMPDISNLTVCAYEAIVFDEPAATLGLKLKPEFLKAPGAKRGSIEIKPAKRSTKSR
jgi:hypothetical protein